MRKRWTILLFLSVALICTAPAQNFEIEAGFGIAATKMDDMKSLQEYMLGTYPVEGKIIASFPAYATGSIGFRKEVFHMVKIGVGYAYTTTGGRSNYTDPSGSISTDIIASSHRVGAYVIYTVLSDQKYDLSLFGRADFNYSNVDVTTSMYVYGYSDGLAYEYKSNSFNGTAGLEFFYHFSVYSIGIDGGYLVDGTGELVSRNGGNELRDPTNQDQILTTDWSGWRAQLKVMIRL
jgi:hypothetical protein